MKEMHNKFITPIWIVLISVLTQGLSKKTASSDGSEVTCGQANKLFQRCFASSDLGDNATKIFLQQERRGIPMTSEEIEENCNIFNRGLECYEDYLDKCMDVMNKRVIVGEVEPAKSLYYMLCKDMKFRANFLAHRDCLRHIEKNWEECTRHYLQIIESEFKRPEYEEKSNINLQHMHFCCARNSYKNCIYNSALSKCNARSAKFARDLVDLLSNERQFKNCAEIEKTSLCSGAVSFRVFINNLSQLTITTLAISLMMLMMAVDKITSL